MDLTKFDGNTPGPWAVDGNDVVADDGSVVADVAGGYWWRGNRPPFPSNARLIAAAPDLLAEVRRLTAEAADLRRERDELAQRNAELAARLAEIEAQEPLTRGQIQSIWNSASGAEPGWSRHITYARAIERAHGIGAEGGAA